MIVTHNINIARTVPDNMGMLFRRKLVMFGPREVLLTSDEPVVRQFLNGRRIGPIGMSEEKDEATMAEEQAHLEAGHVDGGVEEVEGVPPQILATPGMPERKAVARRQARVRENLHLLPKDAQEAILESFDADDGTKSTPRLRRPPPAPRRRDPTPRRSPPSAGTEARPGPDPVFWRRPAARGLAVLATVTEGVVPQSRRVTS